MSVRPSVGRSVCLSVGLSVCWSVAECSEHATYGDRPCSKTDNLGKNMNLLEDAGWTSSSLFFFCWCQITSTALFLAEGDRGFDRSGTDYGYGDGNLDRKGNSSLIERGICAAGIPFVEICYVIKIYAAHVFAGFRVLLESGFVMRTKNRDHV